MMVHQPPLHAQKKARMATRSVSSSLPSAYSQVGDTKLYYRQTSEFIDFLGYFDGAYYGSTYNNGGYKVALRVGDGTAANVDCLNGSTQDGVTVTASVVQQGELARVNYSVSNTNNSDTTVSLGTHADVMIGSNDRAPITRRTDTAGSTYGLTMSDGNGSQLCVLFGAGLAGVTAVDDFWFGYYGLNNNSSSMVGNYSQGSNYMEENGSYDSGMGWCWKSRRVAAGATVTFSYLIGVGEVNLEPSSTFAVTPDDPDGWNDVSLPHKLTLEGTYESPAGVDGRVEYAVEDSEEWTAMTEMIASGSTFTDTLVVTFNPSKAIHEIKFRTVDNVGNTSVLPSIKYTDISYVEFGGIADMTYTGSPLYQQNITAEFADTAFIATKYTNNVNAGTASFNIEGVFPTTIGRKSVTFNILPAPIGGEIIIADSNYVFNGNEIRPAWSFSDETNDTLVAGRDYYLSFSDNVLPGTATISVSGIGNYTSTLSSTFVIDKASLSEQLYSLTLPAEDISYDAMPHAATATAEQGVGEISITYTNRGENTPLGSAPSEEGAYDIYLEISDGELYYGKEKTLVGSFTIYQFDQVEWLALNAIYSELAASGLTAQWDISSGITAVSTFEGLTIEEGHVTAIELSNQGLSGSFPLSLLTLSEIRTIDLSDNNLSGNLPVLLAAAVMQDSTVTSGMESLNISGNGFTGNVGILAACFPDLKSLDVSENSFEDVYPMVSTEVDALDISRQKIDRVVELNLSDVNIAKLSSTLPTVLLYDHENQKYTTDVSFLFTAADPATFDKDTSDDWALQLSFVNGQVSLPYVSEQNSYYGNSGDSINAIKMNLDGTVEGSSLRVALAFDQGDANFIGGVDATDLQATILYTFGGYSSYPFNFTAANTYADSLINVQDVVCTVNILLADNSSQAKSFAKTEGEKVATDADAYVYIEDGKVVLNSATPVAAISIKTSGNIKWNFDDYGMIQSTTARNAVGYSLSNVTLPAGKTVIGTCTAETVIRNVSLSDADANSISAMVGYGEATGIHSIDTDNETDTMIFDLSGRRNGHLNQGLNIIKVGGRTIKILK